MESFLVPLMWTIFILFVLIAGWSYIVLFYVNIERGISLRNRLEFDWWATWGFRVAFLFFLFSVLLYNTVRLFWIAIVSWVDIVVVVLLFFILSCLFGLIVGHVALMVYKMKDPRFFVREARKKKLSQVRARRPAKAPVARRKSFQDSVKYLLGPETARRMTGKTTKSTEISVSLMKVFIFALMGSIITYWILDKIILGK